MPKGKLIMDKKPGRETTREKIERIFEKSVWDVFDELNCRSVEDVVLKILPMSIRHGKGQITTSVPTVLNIIKNGIALGEILNDSKFAKWLPEETDEVKRRGKLSMQDLAEKHFGCPLLELFEKHFSDIKNAEDATKQMVNLSKGLVQCTVLTMVRTIERLLEQNKIEDSSVFAKWIPTPKRRGRKTVNTPEGAVETVDKANLYPVVAVRYTCPQCSFNGKASSEIMGTNYLLGLKGKRCPKCGHFSTLVAEFSYNGKNYRKAVVEVVSSHNSFSMEAFIDEHGKIV